jgi:hypothetical protein
MASFSLLKLHPSSTEWLHVLTRIELLSSLQKCQFMLCNLPCLTRVCRSDDNSKWVAKCSHLWKHQYYFHINIVVLTVFIILLLLLLLLLLLWIGCICPQNMSVFQSAGGAEEKQVQI